MRFLQIALLAVLAVASVSALTEAELLEQDALSFEGFMQVHGKQYGSDDERLKRFAIFRENQRRSEQLAKEHPQAEFGVTMFSDLSAEEFKAQYLKLSPESIKKHVQRSRDMNMTVDYQPSHLLGAPTSWDLRAQNMMSPVKNQGVCGCCWSFAALHEIESQMIKKGWGTYDLSEQQLVDCDTSNDGCDGGFYTAAWEYVYNNGGVEQESLYKYQDGRGQCRYVKSQYTVAINSGANTYVQGNSNIYNYLYTHGAAAAAIDATLLQTYKSGVLNPPLSSCPSVNHAVLLAGYSSATNPPYMIVKNSWSATWGVAGYFYIGISQGGCGIMDYVYGSRAFLSN